MAADLDGFLAGIPALSGLDAPSRAELAGAFELHGYADRAVILRQGMTSSRLYLLRRGTVAVRVQRAGRRETVAELLPPSFFGELSFLTGRTCSADVEALGPVEVAMLSTEALAGLGRSREALLQLLLQLVAARLHDTVTGRPTLRRPRTVLVRPDASFGATLAFATELASGLREGSVGETLLVAEGLAAGSEPRPRTGAPFAVAAPPSTPGQLAERMDAWRRDFRYTIVVDGRSQTGVEGGPSFDAVCDLVAGAAPLPSTDAATHVVAADAARARIAVLSGSRQLLYDAAAADAAFAAGGALPPRFRRTAGSLARAIAGRQVGLALGGGGACCWAHIGLLSVLEKGGIPVDMMAGCSMGSLIGGLAASGRSVADMMAIADYWRTHYRRMVELRFWRMHLISERGIRAALAGYFGERELNTLEVPFWANAVDVLSGEEVIVDRGRVSDTIRASMALPGSSPPFEYGSKLLVDAAVLAPVPVNPVRAMGADFVIAMNVMPSMHAGSIRRRNPLRFLDVLFRSLRISGHEIGRNRSVGEADVMLTPALESHSLLDFSRSDEIIRAGVEVGERHRAQIQAGYDSLVTARS